MPRILNLSAELLRDIVSLVPEPGPLLKVCKIFRYLATPLVYRHISLQYLEGIEDVQPIELLLRTIVGRPALGALVRRLTVVMEYTYYDLLLPFSLEGIRALVMEAAASQNLSKAIKYKLAAGCYESTLFLLLCYFPKLEVLEFDPMFTLSADEFLSHISSSDTLPAGLQSLHTIHMTCADSECTVQQENMFALFRLPLLRTFICFELHIKEDGRGDCVSFNGLSQFEEITMDSTVASDRFLASMVRSTRALRSFFYLYGAAMVNFTIFTLDFGTFIADNLGNAFRANTLHTLEDLYLIFIPPIPSTGSFGPLGQFTKLKRVTLSMSHLLGSPNQAHTLKLGELLPPSLTSLSLQYDAAWWGVGCPVILRLLETNLPRLKFLEIDGKLLASEERMLETVCLMKGIQFIGRDV